MFLKKMAVTVLAVVTVLSMSMTAFAAGSRSSGGGGGGGGSSSGSSTGSHASTKYNAGGPGASGSLAGMNLAQTEANGDKWYVANDGTWKVVLADGSLAKGWQLISWTWENETQQRWFFFNVETGEMATGLVDVNGKTYYLNPVSDGFKGAMITGTVPVNGQTLSFAETGELLN